MDKMAKYQRVNLAFRITNEREMLAFEMLKEYEAKTDKSATQIVTELILKELSNGKTENPSDFVGLIIQGVTENIKAELQKLSIKGSENTDVGEEANEYYDSDDDLDNLDVFGF